ncbi:MAG: 30S ribosomal protein S6 [Chloroherpetonaceae bacterium]|nr:30S ribosomal protein S6 [Chthonomonadaceae bacterium]MDW8206983.1 30S ribosomal protein S6 [Chloroherpetonaceae bacterium]
MRHYEAMYIVDPDVPDESVDAIVERFKKVVEDAGGEVTEAGLWEKGRRPLAYEINKKREGIYVLMQFAAEPEVPRELDRLLRISDEIMRHIIVRQDEDEE